MIVTVSIIFFVLEAPVLILICLIQGGWIQKDWYYIDLVWTSVNIMMYTNHVINFITYAMAGTKFRRELLRLLCVNKILKFLSQYKILNVLNNPSPNHTTLATHAKPANTRKYSNPITKHNNEKTKAYGAEKENLIVKKAKSANEIEPEENTSYQPTPQHQSQQQQNQQQQQPQQQQQQQQHHKQRKLSRMMFRRDSRNFKIVNFDIDINNCEKRQPVSLTSLIVNKKALLGESVVTISHHQTQVSRSSSHQFESSNTRDIGKQQQQKHNRRSSDMSTCSSASSDESLKSEAKRKSVARKQQQQQLDDTSSQHSSFSPRSPLAKVVRKKSTRSELSDLASGSVLNRDESRAVDQENLAMASNGGHASVSDRSGVVKISGDGYNLIKLWKLKSMMSSSKKEGKEPNRVNIVLPSDVYSLNTLSMPSGLLVVEDMDEKSSDGTY